MPALPHGAARRIGAFLLHADIHGARDRRVRELGWVLDRIATTNPAAPRGKGKPDE